MKITIDTEAKTFALDQPVSMDELLKLVKAFFPDDWKQWKLDTKVVQNVIQTNTIIRETALTWPYEPLITYGQPIPATVFEVTC